MLRLKINEAFRCLQKGFELYFQWEWDRDETAVPNAFELEYLILPPVTPEYGDSKVLAHIRIVKEKDSGARVYQMNQAILISNFLFQNDDNFLKAPFLKACREAGLFDERL